MITIKELTPDQLRAKGLTGHYGCHATEGVESLGHMVFTLEGQTMRITQIVATPMLLDGILRAGIKLSTSKGARGFTFAGGVLATHQSQLNALGYIGPRAAHGGDIERFFSLPCSQK